MSILHKRPEETCILSNESCRSACTLAHCRNGKIATVTDSIRTRAETVHTFLYVTVGSFMNLI